PVVGLSVTSVTICRIGRGRRLQTELARRAGSSEAIPISNPSHPAQFPGRVSRDRVGQLLINLSASLLFLFLTSRSFPSPWYLLSHILASFLLLRYCHYHSCPGHILSPPSPTSPFLSPLLRPPFSLQPPRSCSSLLRLSILPLQADVPPLP
ncbi:hypothetical protein BGY98DRAFT_646350, partial [Russula aff. rugulosa BPL654]